MTSEEIERIEIPTAKGALVRFFILSLAGVVSCALVLRTQFPHPTALDLVARGLAAIGVFACAITGLFAARRLFDRTPGLILDPMGIVDNSNAIGAGRVGWDEITEIRVTQAGRQRFLTILVTDPRKFIDRGGSLRRTLYEANARKSGSPVNVTLRTLGIRPDALVALVSEYYRRYGGSTMRAPKPPGS